MLIRPNNSELVGRNSAIKVTIARKVRTVRAIMIPRAARGPHLVSQPEGSDVRPRRILMIPLALLLPCILIITIHAPVIVGAPTIAKIRSKSLHLPRVECERTCSGVASEHKWRNETKRPIGSRHGGCRDGVVAVLSLRSITPPSAIASCNTPSHHTRIRPSSASLTLKTATTVPL